MTAAPNLKKGVFLRLWRYKMCVMYTADGINHYPAPPPGDKRQGPQVRVGASHGHPYHIPNVPRATPRAAGRECNSQSRLGS